MKIGTRLIIGALLLPSACLSTLPAQAADADLAEVFVREGCRQCAKADEFLTRLEQEQANLHTVIRDVQKESAATHERPRRIARTQGVGAARVPALFVRGQLIPGVFGTGDRHGLIRGARAGHGTRPCAADAGTCGTGESLACRARAAAEPPGFEHFELSLFGRTMSLADVGLPV